MTESLIAVIFLFAVAGLPIIVIDALIIRKIRRLGPAPHARTPDDRSTDR